MKNRILIAILLTITIICANSASAVVPSCAERLGVNFTPNQRVALCSVFGSAIGNSLIPNLDNTYDLGSASFTWRTLYTGISRIAKTSDILRVRQDANRLFTWDGGSDTALTMTWGDSTTAVQKFTISASTADAADDGTLRLAGGGAAATDGTRGGEIDIAGEEVSGGGDITYNAAAGDTHIFQIAGTTEEILGNDNIAFTGTANTITSSTADGSDNATVTIAGGGATSGTRGARIDLIGNEDGSNPGVAFISAGSVSAGHIILRTNNAGSNIRFEPNASLMWTMAPGGTFIGAGTATIGWSVQAASNQACTTTCTTPCVVGIDTLGTGGFLDCATATADYCLCAGAS